MGVSNDQIYAELIKLNGFMGGLKEGQQNNHEFIVAVNAKADKIRGEAQNDIDALREELTTHNTGEESHGAGGQRRAIKWVFGGIAALEAIIRLGDHFFK